MAQTRHNTVVKAALAKELNRKATFCFCIDSFCQLYFIQMCTGLGEILAMH